MHGITRRSLLCAAACAPMIGCALEPETTEPTQVVDTPEPKPTTPLIVVAEGDSLTASPGSWAHQLGGVTNLATPGERLKEMLDKDWMRFDASFRPGAIATLWGGTNDLTAFPEVTAEWLLDKTLLWVAGRIDVGFRVAVFTMLPRLRWTEAQEEARRGFNEALPAALPAGAIAVDVCSPPGTQGDGVMYKKDAVHLTEAGQLWILENRIRPALLSLQ